MDTKRLIIFGGIIAAIVLGVSFFSPTPQSKEIPSAAKPMIAVSTFALYEIANAVAGDAVKVHPIIPLGTDAHMFTPNPSQVADISKAALFVYNGAGFESWAGNLKNTLPSTTHVVDMSQNVVLLKSDEHHGEASDGEHHHEGAYDPHYWLNIDNMVKMTQIFDAEFSKLLPAEAEVFHGNAATYIGELQRLKAEYRSGLAECKNRTLISNHDAFGYLASANKLQNVSVIGLSSDEQPSAKNIADIIATVNKHGVKTIFFEEFINDNVSQTIAKETGSKAVALQPLENISQDELKSHQTYLTIMRENLKKLREAMECR